jgi:hypothetical protein
MRERARERVFGTDLSNRPTVTPPLYSRNHRFKDLARLIVNGYSVNEDGLSFQVTVLSNLGHVAVPHDLIPVTLESPDGRDLDTVIVLTPPPDQNVCTFSASYTWNQLAKLLDLRRPTGSPAREAVLLSLPQAGVRAEWWDNKNGPNAPAYYSGGIEQKNGSGRIDLRPVTIGDLKESETVRKTTWSAGEPLRESRPVYRAFKDLLQPGMEMATALEAESEFLITGEQHVSVVAKLRALYAQPDDLKALGVVLMSAEDVRRCNDIYYDVPELTLLRNAIILRRRRFGTDEPGAFLLTVKGRTVSKPGAPGERIRLAAHAHLIEDAGPSRLRDFLADDNLDNAFARVLADALSPHSAPSAGSREWQDVAPRLFITAQRVRYSFELEHSTTIDLSADSATGTDPATGRSRTIHTVAFGITHPGLRLDDTGSSSSSGSSTGNGAGRRGHGAAGHGENAAGGNGSGAVAARRRVLVTRPYHVPADLENPALFEHRDYARFQELRDRMMHHLFGYAAKDLAIGGSKAHTLAVLLRMI